ncbi:mynd finger [Colletotrichum plurivorum]|uniref:Mynd finger n=1 Tax=Colletotrichum plurivorum TaxID=2175906 RepID=A0A8H6NF51_9PEZI|nr:mynd finger [Colletotrichum plurivorum]
MADEQPPQGLYSQSSSIFPLTGEHHLMRLVDLSGFSKSAKGEPFVLNDESRRNLSELDYHTFQEGLPSYLDRTKRYDRMPGDPLDRLFAALPTPEQDEVAYAPPNTEAGEAHDRRFVLAIWPYANSSLEGVLEYSSDTYAQDYWWMCRFAFSLWQRSDLSIRCSFTQQMAHLAVSVPGPAGPAANVDAADQFPIPGSYPASSSSSSSEAADPSLSSSTEAAQHASSSGVNDTVDPSANKQAWLLYALWIYEGRCDEDAEIAAPKRAAKANMSDDDAMGLNTCAFCKAPRGVSEKCISKRKEMFYCTGCYLPYFKHLRRMYCSKECQVADWSGNHFYECQKRLHFLRAVYMLRTVVGKFQTATYSNFAEYIDTANPSNPKSSKADKGARRTFVSSPAWSQGTWVGDQVFLGAEKTILADLDPFTTQKLLAWDSGDNLYYHLQHIIRSILLPHCDSVMEMNVFFRNVKNDITVGASDISRENGQYQASKGKDAMFWPRPILLCRIKCSETTNILYVLDFLGANLGFEHYVVPFEAFAKKRLVSCVSTRSIQKLVPHWYPRSQLGLIACRDYVARSWLDATSAFFKKRFPHYKIPGVLAKLKHDVFQKYLVEYLNATNDMLQASTQAIRATGSYRLYLHHNPNPYGHEHMVGVTASKEEVELYKNIWVSDAAYDITIGRFSSANKTLSVGSETRRLVAMWIDRLVKYGQKHRYDAPKLLGQNLANHYNLSGTTSLEECREIEATYLIWSGIPKEELDSFYSIVERMRENLRLSDGTLPVQSTGEGFVTPEAMFNSFKQLPIDDVVRQKLRDISSNTKMSDLMGRAGVKGGEAMADLTIQEVRRFIQIGAVATTHSAAYFQDLQQNLQQSCKGKERSD